MKKPIKKKGKPRKLKSLIKRVHPLQSKESEAFATRISQDREHWIGLYDAIQKEPSSAYQAYLIAREYLEKLRDDPLQRDEAHGYLRDMGAECFSYILEQTRMGKQEALRCLLALFEFGIDALKRAEKKHPQIIISEARDRIQWPGWFSCFHSKDDLWEHLKCLKTNYGLGSALPYRVDSKTEKDAPNGLARDAIREIQSEWRNHLDGIEAHKRLKELYIREGLKQEPLSSDGWKYRSITPTCPDFKWANWSIWKKMIDALLDAKWKPKGDDSWELEEISETTYVDYLYPNLKSLIVNKLQRHKSKRSAWTDIKAEVIERAQRMLLDRQ